VYIDDYSKPDPIPDSMLKSIAHVQRLLFPEHMEKEQPTSTKNAAPPLPAEQPTGSVAAMPSPAPDKKAKS
jgi:hypothetical protein